MSSIAARICAILLIFASWNGWSSEPPQGQELLAQMGAVITAKTFSADMEFTSSQTPSITHIKWFRRTRLDGEVEMRMETGTPGRPMVYLILPDGMWTVFMGKAAKRDYLSNLKQNQAQYLASIGLQTTNATSTFTVKDAATKDGAYYIVNEVVSENRKTAFKDSLDAPKAKEIISQYKGLIIPTVSRRTYVIAKADFIPKSLSEYAENGTLIRDIKYTNVQVNKPLTDDLFLVPPNIRQVTINSVADYQRFLGGDPGMVMEVQPTRKWFAMIILGFFTASFIVFTMVIMRSSRRIKVD